MHHTTRSTLLFLLVSGCVPPGPAQNYGGGVPAPDQPAPVQLSVAGSGQSLARVTSDPAIEGEPSLSPDGRTLLVTVQVDEVVNGQYTGNKSESVIVGVSPDAGAGRTVYTSNRFFSMSASWVPGGSSFVFATNQMGKTSLVKSLSNSPNPAISVVVSGDNAPDVAYPKVSPDGKRVCFQMNMRGTTMVGLANLDGSNFTVLAEGSYPSFSPDGSKILFGRQVGDYAQIFLIDARTGSGLVQLTNDEINHAWPAWSPDGQYVVYASNAGWDQYGGQGRADTTANIFALKADGTGLTQLTTGVNYSLQPHWASDGWLYFSNNESGSYDIWRLQPGLGGPATPEEPPPPAPEPAPAPASSK